MLLSRCGKLIKRNAIRYRDCIIHIIIFIASPIITIQPQSKTFKEKERSVLALWIAATGVGPIYYTWQKYDPFSDSWVLPSNRAENAKSLKLKFSMITEEDQGIYHCIVSNGDGHVISDNINITVYGMLYICHYIEMYNIINQLILINHNKHTYITG